MQDTIAVVTYWQEPVPPGIKLRLCLLLLVYIKKVYNTTNMNHNNCMNSLHFILPLVFIMEDSAVVEEDVVDSISEVTSSK